MVLAGIEVIWFEALPYRDWIAAVPELQLVKGSSSRDGIVNT
jgi:hypothetical protein